MVFAHHELLLELSVASLNEQIDCGNVRNLSLAKCFTRMTDVSTHVSS